MQKDKVFHVISNTHWDREWRYSYQRNRKMLVDMIDSVLDILEKEPKYKAFHLDSQSIVLDDYLQIKPHKKDLIKKLVKKKRLFIGPWYILPDEFQVGGENLIRNLLLGHKVCREFGGASKTGYSPFSWGQVSQLPQIYNGFDIDFIMFYRGVNSLDSKKAEFIWEGADGTRTLTSRFSTMPRYNFYFYIYRPVVHNEGFSDVEYKWERGGTPFHNADGELKEDYYVVNPTDTFYPENIKDSVEKIINDQADDFTTPHVIWMEGHDSSGPNIKTVDIIKGIRNIFPELDIRHSTLEDYSKLLKESADYNNLSIVKGERRSAQYDRRSGNMFGYTTSARMDIKLMNFEAEKWLQYYAEPLNTCAGILGFDINDNYLDLAWNNLIQNSAHDSIGGCSLDEIHDDMKNRYKQVIEISQAVQDRSLKRISSSLNLDGFNYSEERNENKLLYLNVFNTLAIKRNSILELFIDIPKDLDLKNFRIVDAKGNEAQVQILERYNKDQVLEQMIDRPMFFKMVRYRALVEFNELPSMGYKAYQVIPQSSKTKSIKKDKALTLENDFIKVKINNNATIDLYDKTSNLLYKKLCYLFDEGEAGHAWVHKPVKPFINSLKEDAKIEEIEKGTLRSIISCKFKLKIPCSLKGRNKKEFKNLPVEIKYILERNSKFLKVELEVDNQAEAHRLRVHFPTPFNINSSFGEGQFDVVERSTERPNTKEWVEQPMYDYPMHHFVDVTDDNNGLSILVDGLKEYEVLADKKTLAITLLRAFNYVIAPSCVEDYHYKKGSHCLGKHKFSFAIYPHLGNYVDSRVFNEALIFNYKPAVVQMGISKKKLPVSASFFKLEPESLTVSCFKQSDDKKGYILRFYNPTNETISGNILLTIKHKKVEIVTLEEKFISNLVNENKGIYNISVEKKKIVNLKILV